MQRERADLKAMFATCKAVQAVTEIANGPAAGANLSRLYARAILVVIADLEEALETARTGDDPMPGFDPRAPFGKRDLF